MLKKQKFRKPTQRLCIHIRKFSRKLLRRCGAYFVWSTFWSLTWVGCNISKFVPFLRKKVTQISRSKYIRHIRNFWWLFWFRKKPTPKLGVPYLQLRQITYMIRTFTHLKNPFTLLKSQKVSQFSPEIGSDWKCRTSVLRCNFRTSVESFSKWMKLLFRLINVVYFH